MQLELRHLSCYLPYGIDVHRVAETGNPQRVKLTVGVLSLWEDDYYIDFKPILRPLSDFSNRDWIEVFQAGFKAANVDIDFANFDFERHGGAIEVIESNEFSISFDWLNHQFDTDALKFNQRAALEKIYELKGDLHDLIPSGLAIDANTLNN